jgi:hypothetical protein
VAVSLRRRSVTRGTLYFPQSDFELTFRNPLKHNTFTRRFYRRHKLARAAINMMLYERV